MTWSVSTDEGVLVARFDGHLSEKEGELSARAFVRELQTAGIIDVAFDVRAMTGYDRGARVARQRELYPVRDCILTLEVRGGNSMVRMGASVMALALGIEMRVV